MPPDPGQLDLDGFHQAAESLKLYRRADLHDIDPSNALIEELYVDPLPHEQVLNITLRPNTTFIIGRKGTGKSTIFQRLQYDLRRTTDRTSAYLDIKTIYESAQISPEIVQRISEIKTALPPAELEKVLLLREFLRGVIAEIKTELRKRVESSLLQRLKEFVNQSVAELFEGLDGILIDADLNRFISVLALKTVETSSSAGQTGKEVSSDGASIGLSQKPEMTFKSDQSSTNEVSQKSDAKFSDILLHSFQIKTFLIKLKELLAELKIRKLYILIDDFSELPEEAMKVVVDVVLAPLNNWSEEFIKFKIAAYPGRIYYGQIDKTKADEVFLDLCDLYGTSDVGNMESSAIGFTQRLVEGRISHFCNSPVEAFFEAEPSEIWRLLFFATMANPRNLGWILSYLHESHLIQGRRIGPRAIREAARRYYEEKIESYFRQGQFLHETFNERSSIFSLKELLESVTQRAKSLRHHASSVMQSIEGQPPTSHFYVRESFESLLSTLELNFFVTRYFHMSDRDGKKVTVYALNYGLCQKYSIEFGRPTGRREFRLYFVERVFDCTQIIQHYIRDNQEITCDGCGARYDLEKLEALRMFGMQCPTCRSGTCRVYNLSRKYAKELENVNQELLLPSTEFGMLQTLHSEQKPLRAATIAGELDCSYQLIGKRGKILAERGLVKRSENSEGKRTFEILPDAEKTYFQDGSLTELNV